MKKKIVTIMISAITTATIIAGCAKNSTSKEATKTDASTAAVKEVETNTLEDIITLSIEDGSLKNEGSFGEMSYVIYDCDYYDSNNNVRGYYINTLNEPDAPYYITICSGMHSTGGYSIEFVSLELKGDTVTITVKEIAPDINGTVTEAFTYPSCQISIKPFNKKLVVKNTEGEELKYVDHIMK